MFESEHIMEKIPMPEKPGSHQSFMDLMGAKMEKQMERGNLSFILAAVLPLVCIAMMQAVSMMQLAGLAVYELLLVAGVAWGTKKYFLLYSLQGQKYPITSHLVIIFFCGMGAALMVLIPSRWYIIVLIWIISLIISLACQLRAGQQKSLWAGFAIEFAMAVRAGYLFCLAVSVLAVAGYVLLGNSI